MPLTRLISALESEIKKFGESAVQNPPDKNLLFHYGKLVGTRIGLETALNVASKIQREVEEAHEIRR